jgi:two-component system sensor histidine kinase TctE
MSRLVSQLLALARYEAKSDRTRNFSAVDLRTLAFDTTTAWVPEAYKRNIDLGFEGGTQPVLVNGDAVGLNELLKNLLDNAVRYTHPGGRVTVRVANGGTPTMAVSDDGPSIPIDERDRIFQRFHRLLGSHADGSGLGLAIVREIAALHDASVALTEDSDGVGNTFTVTFPAL